MKKNFLTHFSNKVIYYFLFLGFLLSVCLSIYYVKVFDKTFQTKDRIFLNAIVGKKDTYRYLEEANQHIINLKNNNLINSKKPEYTSTWLHSKILAIYLFLSSSDFFLSKEKLLLEFNKLIFFTLQSLFFYLSLFFFFQNVKEKYRNYDVKKNGNFSRLAFFCTIFLAFEPTIFQYHSSLYTESIFISINIIIFALLINFKISYSRTFLIGILVGFAYLQRGIAIYYFIPITIYYFLILKKGFIKLITPFFISFFLILVSLGLFNYLRTNKFFIKPLNSYIVIPRYFVVQLLYPEIYGINLEESRKKFYKSNFDLNKINGEINKQRILAIFHYKAINEVFKFPIESFLVIIKNLPKSLVLDPLEIFNTYQYNLLNEVNQKFAELYKIFRIIYSFLLYFIMFIGFIIFCKKKENIPLITFIVIISSYFLLITVLDGATQRIFLPSIIYLSIFFSSGVNFLFCKQNKKLIINN